MAVTTVTELYEGRSGGITSKGYSDRRIFMVITDSASDTAVTVVNATELPVLNDVHPDSNTIVCVNKAATPEVDATHWKVTCTYESGTSGGSESGDVADPCTQPAQISISFSGKQRVAKAAYKAEDTLGNPTDPIQNSAKDPIVLTTTEYDARISVTRNERKMVSGILDYGGCVNKTSITVGGIRCLKGNALLEPPTVSNAYDAEGKVYYQISYTILVSLGGHNQKVLDEGYHYLDGTTKKHIQVDGKDVTSPQKLNGEGAVLTTGGYYLDFQLYPERNFARLGLPKRITGV